MDFEPKTLGGGEQDCNHRVGYLQTPNGALSNSWKFQPGGQRFVRVSSGKG